MPFISTPSCLTYSGSLDRLHSFNYNFQGAGHSLHSRVPCTHAFLSLLSLVSEKSNAGANLPHLFTRAHATYTGLCLLMTHPSYLIRITPQSPGSINWPPFHPPCSGNTLHRPIMYHCKKIFLALSALI
jgi:hypothetical protein